MPQAEHHEYLAKVAKDTGWKLHEHGIDVTCTARGENPRTTPIWLKPCVWDESQMIPVGCLCCTDLAVALAMYAQELSDLGMQRCLIASGRAENPFHKPKELPHKPKALAPPPDWIEPYSPY